MCIVPLLLDYLQLNILVIQSLIECFGPWFRESESSPGEEVCNLFRAQPVAVVEVGVSLLVLFDISVVVQPAAFADLLVFLALRLGNAGFLHCPLGGQRALHLGRCNLQNLGSLARISLGKELAEVVGFTSRKGGSDEGRRGKQVGAESMSSVPY